MISVSAALPNISYAANLGAPASSAAAENLPDASRPSAVTDTETASAVPSVPAGEDKQPPFGILSKDIVTQLQGENDVERTEETRPLPESGKADESENALGLSEAEQAQVDSLQERDAEVRTHEQAHAITGGAYAGSPSYEYETGPDGRQYAVGGEVSIDTAPIPGDPAATIAKMETVIRAALAPAEPSGPDRAVAVAASKMKFEAQVELNSEKQAERTGETTGETTEQTKAVTSGQDSPAGNSESAPPQGNASAINLIA
ncbi:hypothetical protein A9Q83_03615 [Alphaproteobacteria bacterium 46_93_T64]|nr:hypothetical protein A9Q83_03615 [Alphaproteobacteria bacterium 46_93_T64]